MKIANEKWHAESIDAVLKKLESSLDGLTWVEAENRLKKYGFNELPLEKKHTVWQRIANQFHNVLIYILLIASIVTASLQHWIDTGVILSAVILNALVGFIQEGKAEKSIHSLKKILSLHANAMRSGKQVALSAEKLVPGDIIMLHSGNKVPADLRLIKTKNLQIQEAILTGESLPVEKNAKHVSENASLAERFSMAYSGTFVTQGTAVGIVIATGKATEIGQISTMLAGVEKITTPLIRQMSVFSRWLAIAILFFSITIFLFGIFVRHYPIDEMFIAAVAIAVAAIPEGLPAIMTIILAVGVMRMAKHHAIVRRLPAVEILSAVTVICTDKTGTLTKNELTVQHVVTTDNNYIITGSGYNDDGKIILNHDEIIISDCFDLLKLIQAGMLCNEASLYVENNVWHLNGSPIDGALLSLGFKAGLDYKSEIKINHRIDIIPFESAHKFMASLHHDHKGHATIFVKGATERLIEICSHQLENKQKIPINKICWEAKSNQLAKNGMRVLAFAFKPTTVEHVTLQFKDVENDFIFLGLVGIVDSPRVEVPDAVAMCQQAGISVKMITGDHSETACFIGKQIGINYCSVLTGNSLDAMDDNSLAEIVNDIDIYARTTPQHKLRLIDALRKHGHIIAMTGDGVNDAPALQRADIGIAMGQKGSDVTKETAQIILADDNFASITQAVKEGRTVYDNLKKIILFLLPNDAGEGLSVFISILLGYTLPITPLQILWVNLVTAVTLGLALAFEPSENNLMLRKPRNPIEALFSRFLLWRIGFFSFLIVIGMFGLFIFDTRHGIDISEARTAVVNLLVLTEVLYLINCRSIYGSVINKEGIFGNSAVLISIMLVLIFQIGFTYLPVMQSVFQTQPISINQWILIILIATTIFFFIEIEKWIVRLYDKSRKQLYA